MSRYPLISSLAEHAGVAAGAAFAVPFAALSALRRARGFHPRGVLLTAEVVPAPDAPAHVADRLAGPAIVRLSASLHASPDGRVDLLGCAIRLLPRDGTDGPQDLLLVTSRTLAQMPLNLLTTRTADYLANDYYGITPFEIDGTGDLYVRARGSLSWRKRLRTWRGDTSTRTERLLRALARRTTVLRLQMRARGPGRRYRPLADIHLHSTLELDQEALSFSPFHTGRGIQPRGFINHLRRLAYPASARARRATQRHLDRDAAEATLAALSRTREAPAHAVWEEAAHG